MGGSGGGGSYGTRRPKELRDELRRATSEREEEFRPVLQEILDSYLTRFNDRDSEKIASRRSEIQDILKDELDTKIDLPFGGSVAKHTYVDGISDVDSLLVLRNTSSEDFKPSEIRDRVCERLQRELDDASVTTGRMAVTVSFNDGTELQLVPAVREGDGFRVPSAVADRWSRIRPKRFQEALSKRNEECNGKLVPTIKLAKAVNANLPERNQLTGYHIESLGIQAFRGYDGTKTTSAMLPKFMERISQDVKKPIKDSTGQSIHVDDYLGKANSADRLRISNTFERIAKKMRSASGAQSRDQWHEIFGEI
jgi:hypothetical protein